MSRRRKKKTYLSWLIVLIVGVILIIGAAVYRFGMPDFQGKKEINTSSLMTGAIDIAELSSAEFQYRGIAETYENEEKRQGQCRICYNAVVKAGVDVKKIKLDIDETNKTVTVTLPEIELKVTIIDEQSMALLPSNANVELSRMLTCSKEDAEKEARESKELMKTASENLKAMIEGLLYPILNAEGYSLIWG